MSRMARPMGHPRAPGLGVVCAGAALFALAPALQARQSVVTGSFSSTGCAPRVTTTAMAPTMKTSI